MAPRNAHEADHIVVGIRVGSGKMTTLFLLPLLGVPMEAIQQLAKYWRTEYDFESHVKRINS
jgi:hypothetical protein